MKNATGSMRERADRGAYGNAGVCGRARRLRERRNVRVRGRLQTHRNLWVLETPVRAETCGRPNSQAVTQKAQADAPDRARAYKITCQHRGACERGTLAHRDLRAGPSEARGASRARSRSRARRGLCAQTLGAAPCSRNDLERGQNILAVVLLKIRLKVIRGQGLNERLDGL